MNSARSDLVVIGGGLAGLTAAVKAAELGLRVVVLEAGTADRYLCNSRLAMGFFNVAFSDIWQGKTVLRQAIVAVTSGAADPDLAESLSENIGPALRWLRSRGVRIIVGNWRPGSHAMLAPPAAIGAGLRWPGRGPDQTLRRLESLLLAQGGRVVRGMRASELIMSRERCVGVTAESAQGSREFLASAVLIADGGFQNSTELLREFVTEYPDRLLMRNAGTARGDGLRMARSVGAKIIASNDFYGHVQSADAFRDQRLWPYPYLDSLISAGLLVDANAKRFADEGLGGVFIANAIARQDNAVGPFVIFDQSIWDSRAKDFPLPANPLLATSSATVYRGETLEALAAAVGLPAATLVSTVAEYNAAVSANATHNLIPARSIHTHRAMPIVWPPFFAVPAVAGITYTMGGIAIDRDGRVKRQAGGTIAGLFAAGATTGGHEGGPTVGYTGGLSKALAFGWCAAHAIAKDHMNATAAHAKRQLQTS
jgi:fumarate reductase flavoprotein subunit